MRIARLFALGSCLLSHIQRILADACAHRADLRRRLGQEEYQ